MDCWDDNDELFNFDESDEMDDFNSKLASQNFIHDIPEPSLPIVSTISALCNLGNLKFNIYELCDYLKENPFEQLVKIKEVKDNNISRKNRKNYCGSKIFYNQHTIIINPYFDKLKKINYIKNINIKLFKNGKIHISGMKDINGADGIQSLHILINYIKYIPNLLILYEKNINDHSICSYENCTNNKIDNSNYCQEHYDILLNTYLQHIEIYDFEFILFNCDFNCGFQINREKILNVINNKYNITATFDSVYQGVKVIFCYNSSYENNEGYCKCTKPCNAKSDGLSDGNCKKITIPIFRSGAIMITGKCTSEHVNYIYKIITNILKESYYDIVQIDNKLPTKYKNEKILLDFDKTFLKSILN